MSMIENHIQTDYNEVFARELERLNEMQRRAVETIEGPVLVIAGPGTGKTQIIAARIGYILSSREAQVQPQNILCLTYTDAGAVAMRKRLLSFIGPAAYRVNIYTFHAFCNDVIQNNLDYFGRRVLEPISELEKVSLIREVIEGLSSTHPLKKFRGDVYSDLYRLDQLFTMMKEEDWQPQQIRERCDEYIYDLPNREEYIYKKANATKGIKAGDLKRELIEREEEKMAKLIAASELFPLYQEKMLAMNRYDFSDMILWVIDAFKKDENLLRNYQEKYLYFLVDEFQDTNGAQNEILTQLTSFWHPSPNLFCVGDDDQSIYEFQGARVKHMKDFILRHAGALTTIVLTDNYRSTQEILNTSANVIVNNNSRLSGDDEELKENNVAIDKVLVAALAERQASTTLPVVHQYPNDMQEDVAVVSKILALKEQGVPLNEIAVIYYRHVQSENIIHLLQKKNVPFNVRKQIDILEIPLIRNLLTLLQYISEESKKPFSAEHLLFEIMHYNFIGIDPHDTAAIAIHANKANLKWRELMSNELLLNSLNLRNAARIAAFEKFIISSISETRNLTLQILLDKILNESGLKDYVLLHEEKILLLQVITTLFNFVKAENTRRPHMTIRDLMEMIDQMQVHGIDLPFQQIINSEDGVNLMTCHSAKGLEFTHVFLIGCTSDKWESSRGASFNFSLPDTLTFSVEENRCESARRLFYVATTRAKEFLYISYSVKDNEGRAKEASRFIYEADLAVQESVVNEAQIAEMIVTSLQPVPKPKIELFDKEYIRRRLENYTLSPTALNSYLDCPIRFYFERILPLPIAQNDSMAFGFCIHESLRILFQKMKKNNDVFPAKEDFIADYEMLMKTQRAAFTEKQFENRLELGRQLLQRYYDQYVHEWNKICVLEYMVRNVEVDGVPIKGKLDKIEFRGSDVNVVDYKTGQAKYSQRQTRPPYIYEPPEVVPLSKDEANEVYGGEYWRQMVFYKILLDHQRGKKWNMVSGEIDYLEKNEKGEFEKKRISISHDDTRFVRHLISSVYQKIMNHEFTTGCGNEDCSWCNFVKEHFTPPVAAEVIPL